MNTQEKIEVMQAYLAGKKIQHKDPKASQWDDWPSDVEPSWQWKDNQYRIKPVARYLNVYTNTLINVNWSIESSLKPVANGYIGYLEDKQDGSPIVFHAG